MTAAPQDIKTVSLELGGKSPFIVFGDSDIEKAVEWIMFGIFWNQGQVCSATSRILVEETIYDAVVERLVRGSGEDHDRQRPREGTLLGPLVSKGQHEKVLRAIDEAGSDGATVACGGERPAGLNSGYFFEPTVLDRRAATIATSGARRFSGPSSASAVRGRGRGDRASPTPAATASRRRSCRRTMIAATRRRGAAAGIVWINCSQPTFTEAPWGGYKQSGIGRELGRWGLSNYLETKQVTASRATSRGAGISRGEWRRACLPVS